MNKKEKDRQDKYLSWLESIVYEMMYSDTEYSTEDIDKIEKAFYILKEVQDEQERKRLD